MAGGWGIEREDDPYHVQNYSRGQYPVARNRLHACAEFIVRYVGFIRESLNQRTG
jgi:hypothetical protein